MQFTLRSWTSTLTEAWFRCLWKKHSSRWCWCSQWPDPALLMSKLTQIYPTAANNNECLFQRPVALNLGISANIDIRGWGWVRHWPQVGWVIISQTPVFTSIDWFKSNTDMLLRKGRPRPAGTPDGMRQQTLGANLRRIIRLLYYAYIYIYVFVYVYIYIYTHA